MAMFCSQCGTADMLTHIHHHPQTASCARCLAAAVLHLAAIEVRADLPEPQLQKLVVTIPRPFTLEPQTKALPVRMLVSNELFLPPGSTEWVRRRSVLGFFRIVLAIHVRNRSLSKLFDITQECVKALSETIPILDPSKPELEFMKRSDLVARTLIAWMSKQWKVVSDSDPVEASDKIVYVRIPSHDMAIGAQVEIRTWTNASKYFLTDGYVRTGKTAFDQNQTLLMEDRGEQIADLLKVVMSQPSWKSDAAGAHGLALMYDDHWITAVDPLVDIPPQYTPDIWDTCMAGRIRPNRFVIIPEVNADEFIRETVMVADSYQVRIRLGPADLNSRHMVRDEEFFLAATKRTRDAIAKLKATDNEKLKNFVIIPLSSTFAEEVGSARIVTSSVIENTDQPGRERFRSTCIGFLRIVLTTFPVPAHALSSARVLSHVDITDYVLKEALQRTKVASGLYTLREFEADAGMGFAAFYRGLTLPNRMDFLQQWTALVQDWSTRTIMFVPGASGGPAKTLLTDKTLKANKLLIFALPFDITAAVAAIKIEWRYWTAPYLLFRNYIQDSTRVIDGTKGDYTHQFLTPGNDTEGANFVAKLISESLEVETRPPPDSASTFQSLKASPGEFLSFMDTAKAWTDRVRALTILEADYLERDPGSLAWGCIRQYMHPDDTFESPSIITVGDMWQITMGELRSMTQGTFEEQCDENKSSQAKYADGIMTAFRKSRREERERRQAEADENRSYPAAPPPYNTSESQDATDSQIPDRTLP